MSSLHRFKLLASQCAVVSGSPTQSPTASPVIHLRRRRTLRMLLSRASDHHHHRRRPPRRDDHSDLIKDPPEKKKVRRKLKDLFVSSPPFDDLEKDSNDADDNLESLPATSNSEGGGDGGEENRDDGSRSDGLSSRRFSGGMRPLSGTLRYRLLRRAWRPVLVTIPE